MSEEREVSTVDGLSIMERKFVAGILDGKNQTQAAIAAGYSPSRAKVTGSEKMVEVPVRNQIMRALESLGLDSAGLAAHAARLLKTKAHAVTRSGDVVELGDDGPTQAKALDMLLKVSDAYPNPRLDVNATIGATIVVRTDDSIGADPWSSAIDVTPGEGAEAGK